MSNPGVANSSEVAAIFNSWKQASTLGLRNTFLLYKKRSAFNILFNVNFQYQIHAPSKGRCYFYLNFLHETLKNMTFKKEYALQINQKLLVRVTIPNVFQVVKAEIFWVISRWPIVILCTSLTCLNFHNNSWHCNRLWKLNLWLIRQSDNSVTIQFNSCSFSFFREENFDSCIQ